MADQYTEEDEPPVSNKYEVVLFNTEVREMVAQGEHHRHLDDVWGENQHVEIRAVDIEDAKRKIGRRYPAHQGYEIVEVMHIQEFG